jgi:hypothetical protein
MISTKENARDLLTSEFSEVKLFACDAEVFDDVPNDAARHIARVPGKRDDEIRAEGIGIMPVAAGVAEVLAADFAQATLQLPAVERGVFGHRSGGQHELVAEGGRDRPACLQKGFQMSFGRFLKAEYGLTPITPMRMATRQEAGFCYPDAVLIPPRLDFRDRHYHSPRTLNPAGESVNALTTIEPNNPAIH